MRQLWMGILAVGSAAALACGGGGGGGGDGASCRDLADTANACITAGGDEADPNIEGLCETLVCDDKPGTIDCVMALQCSEHMGEQSLECMQAHGCAFPASCDGVGYMLNSCAGVDPVEAISECDQIRCTVSKQDTIACLVGLDCANTSDLALLDQVYECFDLGGCPTDLLDDLY